MQLTTLVNGARETRELEVGTYVIGCGAACDIRFGDPVVSDRHAVLRIGDGRAVIEDLQSSAGTFVNGERLTGAMTLNGRMVVQIGGNMLRVSGTEDDAPPEPEAADEPEGTDVPYEPEEPEGESEPVDEWSDDDLDLGPLTPLLADGTVTEIMVNGPRRVYVERNGRLQLTTVRFEDDDDVCALVDRIVEPLGRRIDDAHPYVDARLPDGSRVNAILPPLALSGPTVTIRKFSRSALTADDFVRLGTWTPDAARFIGLCVRLRKNIVVSGGTGSGKTTLLDVISGFIPTDERIVTIEDAAELRLRQPHVVRLEARPPDAAGRGEVTIRDLVRNALRMRPDRIVVGECRGGEALDMLQAMNTGHDGSLTTVHANSPRDVVSRLGTMALMSGLELPTRVLDEQIARAVDLVIHVSRLSDGTRRVTAITEVTGLDDGQVGMQDIFAFRQTGIAENGRVIGEFHATGAVPTWIDQLQGRGLDCDRSMFGA